MPYTYSLPRSVTFTGKGIPCYPILRWSPTLGTEGIQSQDLLKPVTKDLTEPGVYAGNPARFLRPL
jgi:hypothetical protein